MRGLVYVAEYRRPDPDSFVVTVVMLQFTPEGDHVYLYEQVDEVHVARQDRTSDWRIDKIVGISES